MILLEVLGWLIFLVGIGVSIGLHEIGHLVPAKAFGVKVTQYMVGFGPTMWARRRGETEYGIKWIPLGGYIRMIGMYPPAKGADPTKLRAATTGRWTTLIEDARKQSLDEIAPEDANRVFYKLPVHRRIVIMLGGPTMNLVLAFVMFTIAFCFIGLPVSPTGERYTTNTVGRVVECVPTLDAQGAPVADGGCPTSGQTPAYAGGLQVGDTIVSFAGVATPTWPELQSAIKGAETGPTAVTVVRAGEELTLTVPLESVQVPVYDDEGKPTGATEPRNFLGIAPAGESLTIPVSEIPSVMWNYTTRSVAAIVTLPVRLWELAVTTFTDAPRDENGPVGPVGIGRITGDVVALENTPVADKAAQILLMLGGLNLFLFLFNLIPLLPLDGGHVAGAVWESIKRGWARLRRKPDPGPVDIAKALPVTYVVAAFLVGMGALVLIADLIEPIRITN
jgi:membrane-associated protease RseP (regulator of RpoE activity)